MRKELPTIVCILMAAVVVLSMYVFPVNNLKWMDMFDNWNNLIYYLAMGLGLINLTRIHVMAVIKRRPNWVYSIWLVAFMWAYMILCVIQTVDGPQADWVFKNFITPIDSTVFALLAFYITSASFRAFRARTLEATLMLLTAFIVLLGVSPLGDLIIPGWGWFKDQLLSYPNAGGQRGITIGIYLGALAAALRVMLGLERAYLGGAR